VLITAQVRYSDLNLLGTSYRLYLPVKYGFSMTAWDRYAVVAPSFVDPYFLLPRMTLRVTPFAVYDRATGNIDVIRFGNEIAVSKDLGHRLYTSLSYEISTVKTRVPDSGKPYSPWVLENKVMPTLTYDGLDQPINPHKGFYASAILSYINAMVLEDFQNFLKFETTLKFFWSIRQFVTFGINLHYGDSKPFDASQLPQDERFTLGGNKGVRGFSHDGIAQYNSDGSLKLVKNPDGTLAKPFGGNTALNGSFEVRFPVVRQVNLFGAGFVDWGGLGEGLRSFNRKTIRVSVGLGLRYILGGQLPIRLDYGFILDRRCKYADPKTGMCVEREEFGNLQFSLLYSF
jgi:outer membrane protein assembly factor BamA